MSRPRLLYLAGTGANVLAGHGLAVLAQLLVFPVIGLAAPFADTLRIGVVFTALSLVRGYLLRRLFEKGT